MSGVKQVIVMRTDLNMRKGKMVAQGAHASLAFLTRNLHAKTFVTDFGETQEDFLIKPYEVNLNEATIAWLDGSFKKICVGVDSEEDLINIWSAARDKGIDAYVVTDSGLTEFAGVPTRTCAAIGPWWSDEIDEITGDLKLL